jgi:glutathione synthetase
MDLLFVTDPLDTFKTYKDSTFAMMREAARRGHALLACEPRACVAARRAASPRTVREIALTGDAHAWFRWRSSATCRWPRRTAVLMRKDPPFDSEYFYATHLLQQAEREGARVFNRPAALRDHPEKLAILEFPQFIGAHPGHARRRTPCAPSTPSRATSSSSRWTAWAAWASSASARRPEPGQHHRDAQPPTARRR